MAVRSLEVSVSGCCIVTRNVNLVDPNITSIYNLMNVKGVVPVHEIGYATRNANTNQRRIPYDFDDKLMAVVDFIGDTPPLEIEIQRVSNQPGWTADKAGLQQAVDDICSWITSCSSGGSGSGGATEATLAAYAALFSGEDTPGGQDLAGVTVNLSAGTYSSFTIIIEAGTADFGGLTYNPGTYSFPARPFKTVAASSIDGTSCTVGKIITMQ